MKKYLLNPFVIIAGIIAISFLFICNLTVPHEAKAQDEIPERLKYFKEKYEENFESDFEKVWNTVKKFVIENGCQISNERVRENDIGKQRGICQTELCILAQHKDSTFRLIRRYALDPPFIRGGVWTSVRMEYRFIVNDLGDGQVNVVLRGELSGFENHATFKAHFFQSNGLLEFMAFERIREMLLET